MNPLLRFFVLFCFAAWTGHASAAVPSKSKEKTSAKAPAKPEASTKAKTDTPAKAEDKPEAPRPAAVSTISIEDISGFTKYPKQVQSLVQSALALTHLELGYLYGSHEPNKGGMDCSGTVYHVLHFQGLKNVPRQSNEMAEWVQEKTQLHLTPTATSLDSPEFADLKPGDLLFWTNTTETKRKLPVTHVMIYLGKHKKTGQRIAFGSSDGRSFEGQRRSGVSVFDFRLPRAESPTHFHGYGRAPGLLPVEPPLVVIAAVSKPVEKTPVVEKAVLKPAQPKEEVRKAVAIVSEAKAEPEIKPDSKKVIVVVPAPKTLPPGKAEVKSTESKPEVKPEIKKTAVADATPKSTTTAKSKTTAPKKKTTSASTTTKRKTPPTPPKSSFERTIDNAVGSVRRFFRQ
ncbi:NlpC/P60 family protein [Prosthecobacter sp.]|uniref:C40 family peptidase n=1 Tax=Prosthecobacter sp. TaxID=1965333 RepID=UPI002ABC02AE|nr:NlpC/P60 family protein [Prosthecobacter sp.]MDZ4402399.1 NlpC/P60 family protein [Prosthecobacter sp.]